MNSNVSERLVVTMCGVDPACLGGISTLTKTLSAELSQRPDIDFEYIVTNSNVSERLVVTMCGVDPACLGGISTLTKTLSAELSQRPDIDFEYIVTSNQGSSIQKLTCFIRAIARASRRFSCGRGVVHIHMADNASVIRSCVLIRLARSLGQSVVLHVHCDLSRIREGSSSQMQKMIDWAITHAGHVIVLGGYLNGLFDSLGYPAERVTILPNAVMCPQLNPYTPGRRSVLFLGNVSEGYLNGLFDSLGYPAERVTILPNAVMCPQLNPYTPGRRSVLFLGNVSEAKGVLDLLDALTLIDDKLSLDIVFDICGKDHLGVVEEIERRGLTHRVRYRGIVTPDHEFFAGYALNILPSHHEAMPFALIEASAHGIPTVATAVGSIPEIIDSGKSGWLVEPKDVEALSALLLDVCEDSSLLREVGDRAYRVVRQRYSLSGYIQRLVGLYRGVCPC